MADGAIGEERTPVISVEAMNSSHALPMSMGVAITSRYSRFVTGCDVPTI